MKSTTITSPIPSKGAADELDCEVFVFTASITNPFTSPGDESDGSGFGEASVPKPTDRVWL